jgi:hypothetical protein
MVNLITESITNLLITLKIRMTVEMNVPIKRMSIKTYFAFQCLCLQDAVKSREKVEKAALRTHLKKRAI